MAEPAGPWCPRCLRTADAVRCFACGLVQAGPPVDRLRHIAVRRHDIGRQQTALAAEDASLRNEQAQLFFVLDRDQAPPVAPHAGPVFEWRWEVVRDLLLWLGAVLVGVAALIFAAVAWGRLSDTGRAALLLAATLVAGSAAVASRRRLPATAAALSGLTVVMVLVDWYVLDRSGLTAWSPAAWWALGTALTAAGSAVATRWFPVQRLFAAVLAQVAAVLVIDQTAANLAVAAVGLALAAALSAAIGVPRLAEAAWSGAAGILVGGALLMLLVAGGIGLSLLPPGDLEAALAPALVFAAMGLAPAAARVTLRRTPIPVLPDGLVAATAGLLVVAVATVFEGMWGGPARYGLVAGVGLMCFATGRLAPLALQRGTQAAGAATLLVAALAVIDAIVSALAGPLAWADAPWAAALTEDAASQLSPPSLPVELDFAPASVVLLATAAAAALCLVPRRGACLVSGAVAAWVLATAAAGAVAVIPLAAAWPLWAAGLTVGTAGMAALVAAASADRGGHDATAHAVVAAGVGLAVTATGWALAAESATLVWFAMLTAAAAVAAATAGRPLFRLGCAGLAAGAALVEVGAVAASAGGNPAWCGFAVATAAGALVAGSAHWPNRGIDGLAVEAVGGGGVCIGTVLAATAEPWLAVSLTVAVAWLAVAGLAADRRAELWMAGWVAVGATWAWLAAGGVGLVEAYTLPAATAALVCGAVAQRRMPALTSWLTWMPGLAVGLGPSLVLAVSGPGVARRLAVTAAGLAVVVAGARAQRQAPLVVGALTLLTMGADALAPVATELPRWVTLGAVGLVLLWLGATAERRVETLQRLRHRFDEMEPEGWSPFLRKL